MYAITCIPCATCVTCDHMRHMRSHGSHASHEITCATCLTCAINMRHMRSHVWHMRSHASQMRSHAFYFHWNCKYCYKLSCFHILYLNEPDGITKRHIYSSSHSISDIYSSSHSISDIYSSSHSISDYLILIAIQSRALSRTTLHALPWTRMRRKSIEISPIDNDHYIEERVLLYKLPLCYYVVSGKISLNMQEVTWSKPWAQALRYEPHLKHYSHIDWNPEIVLLFIRAHLYFFIDKKLLI